MDGQAMVGQGGGMETRVAGETGEGPRAHRSHLQSRRCPSPPLPFVCPSLPPASAFFTGPRFPPPPPSLPFPLTLLVFFTSHSSYRGSAPFSLIRPSQPTSPPLRSSPLAPLRSSPPPFPSLLSSVHPPVHLHPFPFPSLTRNVRLIFVVRHIHCSNSNSNIDRNLCNSRRTLFPSSPCAIHLIPLPLCSKFQTLQEHRKVSLSSLDHFTEYEHQNLFGLKGRAYTTIGLEEGKGTDGRGEALVSGHSSVGCSYAIFPYGGEDKMLMAAGANDAVECPPAKELPPSDSTSGNTTPRQRRKRRSAAERRESHRRRSSAVVHDAVHLAKLLNGLPQQKQRRENNSQEADEPFPVVKPFSPIPDRSETENDETCLHDPPEPSVHAPGDEDQEDIADEGLHFISRLNRELFMDQLCGRRAELGTDVLLQSPFGHKRSLSADHLLHGIGLKREMLLLDHADQSNFADQIQIKMRNSDSLYANNNSRVGHEHEKEGEKVELKEGEEEEENWGKSNGSERRQNPAEGSAHHPASMGSKRPPVSRKTPLLAQIKKQHKFANNRNDRPPTCSSSPLSCSEVRCASTEVKANEDPTREGISIAESAAGSLSGPEASLYHIGTSGWEKEVSRSSNTHQLQLNNDRKMKGNCKRRNSSVSTLSAPCAHSISSSSNVFLHLVDRFVSKRQYSDSNLLKLNVNRPPFGESFCRRSFKWNLFWGRKDGNDGKCTGIDCGDVLNSAKKKNGEDREEEGMRDPRKKSVAHCQQRKSSRLGTLMEDTEIAEDREKKKRDTREDREKKEREIREDREEKTKKHFAERSRQQMDTDYGKKRLGSDASHQQQAVRMRTNSSLVLEEEEKNTRKCPMDRSTGANAVTTQRFSLIGSCDLAKFEESAEEETKTMMAMGGGVRRTTSLKEKYKVREEDSLKLDMFLKERRMRRTAVERGDEGQSEGENVDAQLDDLGGQSDTLHSKPVTSDEHSQQQNLYHSDKNLKKVISPQLNTPTSPTTTSTMPRKKNPSNMPRKSSISIHNVGTLKRKKGIGKSQLARRRSSYVTKAQVLMAKSKMQKEEWLRKNKPREDGQDGADEKGRMMMKGEDNGGKRKQSAEGTKTEAVVTLREGAKLLAKQRGASVTMSSSSLRQLLTGGGERKGGASRGSKVAPKTNNNAEKERTEKDKKRESKANSALLGTIWSIRPRRKKENNRSLANLFCQQNNDLLKFDKEQRTNDDGDSHDVPSADSPKKITLAHSPSATAFSFEQIPDLVSALSPAIFSRSQMHNPRWDDLSIWEEEEPSWAAKFPDESPKLENAERKRQNIIYELMMTEKNHCQVLVLLRQVYQEGLIRNGILDKTTAKKLVPDVLDVLLDFHLNLLRRFRVRSSEETIVRDISDIICDTFVDSPIRVAVIQSYTSFCLAREHSHALLAALMAQKAIVRKFFEFHESEHKDRSFKDCLLLVAQRLTKYPILIEQILKYESLSDQKLKMQKAHFAVKSFALEINDELLRYERKIQWEAVKKALEKGSTGKLIDPKAKQDFTYADLVEPVEEIISENECGRRVHLVQRVFWRETMTSPDVELRLLLCDDIIVFLRPKGASIGSSGTAGGMGGVGMEKKEMPLQFFRHNSHSGVLPLYNTLVKGENLRRKSVLLIVTDKEQPDLIQLAFSTSPEMEQCVHAIKQAKTNAPKFVRLSKRRIFELSQRSIGEGTSAVEKEYQTKMDTWQRELERIFVAYNEDSLLVNYFESRMSFFDSVRAHLCRCPLRNFTPAEEQQQPKHRTAEREKERLNALLKAKFDELGRKRNGALAHLVERAQRARDADLPSFFDDLYDLGAAGNTPPQSSSSSEDQFNQTVGSSDSCENHTKVTEGGGKKKPRRVRTYHGHASTEQKSLSASSGSSAGGTHPIRRHTTVPAGGLHMDSSDDEGAEMDNEIRRLPQIMNPMSRKAATEIIRDNIRLRSQNDRLKRESALKDLQLVSLRSRKGPSGETPERLESLRQKQEELQAEKKEFLTECQRREEEFRANCAGREEKLRRMEDELKVRANEFVRMRKELEKLREERQGMAKGTTETNSTGQCARGGQPNAMDLAQVEWTPKAATTSSSTTMRISNTYCGAGPVPRPSAADHQQQQHAECCSFNVQQPAQLVERRAVSQMELPRHLAVKTETKQADKVRKLRKN